MTGRPAEVKSVHTRLLKCALEIEDSRAYWASMRAHADGPATSTAPTAQQAFNAYWFGARSLSRTAVLLANMRARFDAFPPALALLGRWPHMSSDARRVICHWHLQLADPLYREFTGGYLAKRRDGPRPEVSRDLAVSWIGRHGAARWTMSTRIQFASKLLSAAYSAGLLASNRDPRPLAAPRVPDDALEYLLYLLRGLSFEGALVDNPYLSSVGLDRGALMERLRKLPALSFSQQGDLIDLEWRYPDLLTWSRARFEGEEPIHQSRLMTQLPP